MCKENLLKKANENSETAEWAEQREYYDVSISRYYYCLYEKAIYIAMKNGFYSEPKNGKDSHNKFIANFQKNISNRLSDSEIAWLSSFGKLKRLRINADYKLKVTNKEQFELGFKNYYVKINNILDRLV